MRCYMYLIGFGNLGCYISYGEAYPSIWGFCIPIARINHFYSISRVNVFYKSRWYYWFCHLFCCSGWCCCVSVCLSWGCCVYLGWRWRWRWRWGCSLFRLGGGCRVFLLWKGWLLGKGCCCCIVFKTIGIDDGD